MPQQKKQLNEKLAKYNDFAFYYNSFNSTRKKN